MLRRKRKTKNEIAGFFPLKARKPAKSKRLSLTKTDSQSMSYAVLNGRPNTAIFVAK